MSKSLIASNVNVKEENSLWLALIPVDFPLDAVGFTTINRAKQLNYSPEQSADAAVVRVGHEVKADKL